MSTFIAILGHPEGQHRIHGLGNADLEFDDLGGAGRACCRHHHHAKRHHAKRHEAKARHCTSPVTLHRTPRLRCAKGAAPLFQRRMPPFACAGNRI
jgi:hypothetical protein